MFNSCSCPLYYALIFMYTEHYIGHYLIYSKLINQMKSFLIDETIRRLQNNNNANKFNQIKHNLRESEVNQILHVLDSTSIKSEDEVSQILSAFMGFGLLKEVFCMLKSLTLTKDFFISMLYNTKVKRFNKSDEILIFNQKNSNFYLVLKGGVSVFSVFELNCLLTDEEYMKYVKILSSYLEISLLKYCIDRNESKFPLSKINSLFEKLEETGNMNPELNLKRKLFKKSEKKLIKIDEDENSSSIDRLFQIRISLKAPSISSYESPSKQRKVSVPNINNNCHHTSYVSMLKNGIKSYYSNMKLEVGKILDGKRNLTPHDLMKELDIYKILENALTSKEQSTRKRFKDDYKEYNLPAYFLVADLQRGWHFGESTFFNKSQISQLYCLANEHDTIVLSINQMFYRSSFEEKVTTILNKLAYRLVRCILFKEFYEQEVIHKLYNYFEFINLDANQILFTQGDLSDHIYFIINGQLSLNLTASPMNLSNFTINSQSVLNKDPGMGLSSLSDLGTDPQSYKYKIVSEDSLIGLQDTTYLPQFMLDPIEFGSIMNLENAYNALSINFLNQPVKWYFTATSISQECRLLKISKKILNSLQISKRISNNIKEEYKSMTINLINRINEILISAVLVPSKTTRKHISKSISKQMPQCTKSTSYIQSLPGLNLSSLRFDSICTEKQNFIDLKTQRTAFDKKAKETGSMTKSANMTNQPESHNRNFLLSIDSLDLLRTIDEKNTTFRKFTLENAFSTMDNAYDSDTRGMSDRLLCPNISTSNNLYSRKEDCFAQLKKELEVRQISKNKNLLTKKIKLSNISSQDIMLLKQHKQKQKDKQKKLGLKSLQASILPTLKSQK